MFPQQSIRSLLRDHHCGRPLMVQTYRHHHKKGKNPSLKGFWGIWGEWLFIFRELGFREPCQKVKTIEEKPPFCLIFKIFFASAPRPPFLKFYRYIHFLTNMHIFILLVVDLLSLKLLIFRLVITYFGTPRLHHFYQFFVRFLTINSESCEGR